jgi:hypothetical protein
VPLEDVEVARMLVRMRATYRVSFAGVADGSWPMVTGRQS